MTDAWRPLRRLLLHTALWLDRGSAVCASLAIGTMRLRDLRAGIERRWSGFSGGEDQIASGLDAVEQALFDRFVRDGDRVLVVGCGTGRDTIPLAARGCTVTGIDPLPQAIAAARRALDARGLQADLVEGYVEDVAEAADVVRRGPFDIVLFSNLTYTYIPQSTHRIAVLRTMAAQLAPGGRILVTYFYSDKPHRTRLLRVMQLASRVSRSDWEPQAGDTLTPIDYPRGHFDYDHLFAPGELEREAQEAGLHVVPHREHPHSRAVLVLTRDDAGTSP